MVKPSKTALGKRKAPPAQTKSKKPAKEVETGPTGKPKRKADQPKKVKLRDQKVIPVPKTAFAGRDKRALGDGAGDEDDEDEEDAFDDADLGVEEGLDAEFAGSFARGLDSYGLSRTIKETQRLHEISKARESFPKQERKKSRLGTPESMSDYDMGFDSDEDFPSSLASDEGGDDDDEEDDEDDDDEELGEGSGSTTLDGEVELDLSDDDDHQSALNDAFDEEDEEDEEDESEVEDHPQRKKKRKDQEAEYEMTARARWAKSPPKDEDSVLVGRLPIKLPTGEVQAREGTTRIALPPSKKKVVVQSDTEDEEGDDETDLEAGSDDGAQAERLAGKKGRFGRLGVAEIVGMEGVKNAERLAMAKEQIAQVGAEILAGGELIDIGPVLTRLSTFALPTVPSMQEGQPPLPVPFSIRGLAFLSQLAVYKDLIPGYRIRDLTATEEAEKVRDEVRRLREGEKLLVRSYKGYLKLMEAEVKRKTPLASLSLRCMADLLVSATHFNFSENLMGVLVGRLARKTWDDDSELVLQAFISVFKSDNTAVHSQTLVRLIARMIKERKFQVHPNVLSCLMHLRLRVELDMMRDGKNSKRGRFSRHKGKGKEESAEPKFKSEVRKKWQTKNQRKREKEMKEVRKEQAEAEAEVDKEERAQVQTETLKNLFVLYFSILKHQGRSPLLPSALEGISQFAHFINIDFFRDLLAVLRRIIVDQQETDSGRAIAAPASINPNPAGEGEEEDAQIELDPVGASVRTRTRLLAIVTAFELLSGQGEALNIDLNDFITALFALLRPLSLDTGIEDPPLRSTSHPSKPPPRPLQPGRKPPKAIVQLLSTSELLFRCLHAIFFSRHTASASPPPWRAAAFAKRLTECSLMMPPNTAKQSLNFVRALMSRDSKLEGLLDTEERRADGVYKGDMDDPQLCNPFSTSLWELEDLARAHWDGEVRNEAGLLRDAKVV